MEIAQSEGWAVDGQDDDVDASRDSGPASERGDGNDDQREFLVRFQISLLASLASPQGLFFWADTPRPMSWSCSLPRPVRSAFSRSHRRSAPRTMRSLGYDRWCAM